MWKTFRKLTQYVKNTVRTSVQHIIGIVKSLIKRALSLRRVIIDDVEEAKLRARAVTPAETGRFLVHEAARFFVSGAIAIAPILVPSKELTALTHVLTSPFERAFLASEDGYVHVSPMRVLRTVLEDAWSYFLDTGDFDSPLVGITLRF